MYTVIVSMVDNLSEDTCDLSNAVSLSISMLNALLSLKRQRIETIELKEGAQRLQFRHDRLSIWEGSDYSPALRTTQ